MEKKKIIDYVKAQIGVDLDQYRTEFTKRWENPDEIIVEYREMKGSQWRNIELLASKRNAKIRIESVGVWGKMIALK